ncbi:hypothetical protein DL95DRAFT_399027 [Leptodontidium sp. 2 PMI_412]|nr:hypothetical protein DL95DRAFT_399027 [Leptodontidium sp. 2 PMI_412]
MFRIPSGGDAKFSLRAPLFSASFSTLRTRLLGFHALCYLPTNFECSSTFDPPEFLYSLPSLEVYRDYTNTYYLRPEERCNNGTSCEGKRGYKGV